MSAVLGFSRKIYSITCIFILTNCLSRSFEIATQKECSLIVPEGRISCTSRSLGQIYDEKDCQIIGCCWDKHLAQCYDFTNCRPGYYGWRCHMECNCPKSGSCGRYSGECEFPCRRGRWGVGCLLDNNCTYNDPSARHYTGSRQQTDSNHTCINWSAQKSYELAEFPDKMATSLHSIANFCRNPKGSRVAFCYTSLRDHWDFCTMATCECPRGRYGPSCAHECHCDDTYEVCDPITGHCSSSGCHHRWTGTNCSECSDGYFGIGCQNDCKCQSPMDVCDKYMGTCESGCAPGWQGVSCKEECEDRLFGFNCDFSCNCERRDEVCNKVTGGCMSGCVWGYGGEGCLTLLPILTKAPSIRNRNATSITITWREWTSARDRGTGPIGRYQVFFRPAGREDWIIVANEPSAKEITVTDLSQETSYEFRITPIHVTGLSGLPSPTLNVSTCGRPTSGVLNMKLQLKTEREETLTASWEAPKRDHFKCLTANGYNVYLTNATNQSSLTPYSFVYVNWIDIKNIDVYQNLTVAVALVNNAGLESVPVFQTYTGRSGAVENMVARPINSSSILLTWSPPRLSNGLVKSYLLSYRLVQNANCKRRFSMSRQEQWTPFINVDGNQDYMEITGLNVYSFYRFRLYPKTSSGKGKEAEVTGNTQAIEPAANLSLKLTTINSKSAVVTWDPVECQNYNGEFIGYMYELYAHPSSPSVDDQSNESSIDGQLYLSGVINQTELALTPLIPYLNYTLYVWFANHLFNGRKSSIALETHEDVPPSSKYVVVESKTSESLLVGWSRPDPPQGLITKYSLRYFAVQNTRSASTTVTMVTMEDVDNLSYNITKLKPFGQYGLQVRASTRIGDGPWSELVEEHTEETVPSHPLDLMNTSRSSKDIALQWKAPVHSNGIIRFYSVTCSSANHLNREKVPPVERVVSPPSLNLTVNNLMPGINYVCKVSASTRKGEGPSAWCLLWTEPEISFEMPAPLLRQSQNVDNLIIVDLLPSETIDYMEEPDSLCRVVVQILYSETTGRKKKKRSTSSTTPCDLAQSDLVDFSLAVSRSLECYVAAEIPRIVKTKTFVVGDNKTYGGFYNARLDPTLDHDVWFGLVVTVDGVTVSSYAKTDQPRDYINRSIIKTTSLHRDQDGLSTLTPAAGAVIGSLAAVALLILLVILLMYKILKKRRKHTRSSSAVMLDSRMDSIGEQNAKLLPIEPPESPFKSFHPIPMAQLWDHVVPMRQSDYENLRIEFNEFRKETKFKSDVAKRPENKPKNRYHNIYPYDHSRVILDCLPTEPHSDYINANYIDGYKKHAAYVAAQGPLENTQDDMWRMIWQLNSRVIVMVTNLQEGGRQKCKQYWPDEGSRQYGDVLVELAGLEEYADYAIRTFYVAKRSEKREVKQFHFTTWPDHGIPEHPTSLLEFRKKVKGCTEEVEEKVAECGPILVHCSAGVGRTGCYIALDQSLDVAAAVGCVDVFNFVKKMRSDRANMIQTVEQYIFVYEALLEALQAGVTSIPCSEFRTRHARLITTNPETEKSYLLEEYELLESTNLLYNQEDKNFDLILPENKKNQSNRKDRSHLMPSRDAIFVDGYKHRKAFVVTSSPKDSSNLFEFWSNVVEYNCGAIICLEDQNDEHGVVYFPTSSTEDLVLNRLLSIKLTSSDCLPYFDQQEFIVSHDSKSNRSSKERRVRRFKLKSWTMSYDRPEGKVSLPTRYSVLGLLGALEKWQQYNGNSVVLVHCKDGATHSGIFCAASFMIEKLKIEHEVDVFSSIRHIRVNRPQFVPNLIQYQYLYDLAIDYLDCFDTYANFESSI